MVHLDIIISRANTHIIAVHITLSKFKLDRWGTLRYEEECAKVLLNTTDNTDVYSDPCQISKMLLLATL